MGQSSRLATGSGDDSARLTGTEQHPCHRQNVWRIPHREFGFSTEKTRCLESPFPAEACMAIELSDGALDGVQGKVRYHRYSSFELSPVQTQALAAL
jgi:hypothetical protein